MLNELAKAPVHVVYVDADYEVPFDEVARAVDIVQGEDAKAILVIPQSPDAQRKAKR